MEKLERFLFLAKYLLLKRITPSSHPRHVIPHHSIVNRKRVLYDTSLEIDGKTKFKSITHLRYYNTAMINENTVTTKSTSTLVTSLFNILQKKSCWVSFELFHGSSFNCTRCIKKGSYLITLKSSHNIPQ